jgi:hypothetical protein
VEGIDIVYIFLAFINLSFDPVPIKILEQVVDIFGSDRIAIPFSDVVGQQGLVRVRFGRLNKVRQVTLEVFD